MCSVHPQAPPQELLLHSHAQGEVPECWALAVMHQAVLRHPQEGSGPVASLQMLKAHPSACALLVQAVAANRAPL